MALTVTPFLGGAGSTLVAGQTAAAPAANTLVVASGVLPAGDSTANYYMVSVISGQQGTPDANYSNMYVVISNSTASPVTTGSVIGTLTSFPATSSGGTAQRFVVPINGANMQILICVGNTAGGAGSVYAAGMSIKKVSGAYADF